MNKKGFTIVELVIVIAVIAILAAILIPTFANVVDKANVAKVQAELKNAKTQYIMEASDDKNYNPNLELVYKHVNDKGKVVYYLEEEGVFVPASGSQFDEDNLLATGVYFVPLQYKSGTDEWLFAEFGEGTVGVLAYSGGPAVESYGGFVEIRDTSYNDAYGNTLPPIWKATDSGFEVTGTLTYHNVESGDDPLGFKGLTPPASYFLSFSIEKPEDVVITTDTTIQVKDTIFTGDAIVTEFSNGTFDHIKRIQTGETQVRVIIDWDGTEGLFAPKSYVIDLSKIIFEPVK
ncbi:MAG TPA: prepilin-type N-terminal cleavage/methylation domain-containing protein [Salinivirgaceae bacterium]|nr:prepilin-type N-terminal cleavage/methylation domain-containing protein [Salinivirgaceae bacterium]